MNRLTTDHTKKIYIAESADVVGDVSLGEGVSIWYQAVLRGDVAPISVGRNTNIQDGAIVHTATDGPAEIGDDVSIGHGAIVHACKIGNRTLIGMGAIILDGAVIGNDCIIGAGALVTKNTVIPDGSMAFGSPARVIRPLNDEEKLDNLKRVERYLRVAQEHFGAK